MFVEKDWGKNECGGEKSPTIFFVGGGGGH